MVSGPTDRIYYNVAVTLPLDHPLTYAHPPGVAGVLAPGVRVLVPVQRQQVTGFVLGEAGSAPCEPARIREIIDVLDPEPLFPASLIDFFRWVADYYHHPLGEVFKTALPGGLRPRLRRWVRKVLAVMISAPAAR